MREQRDASETTEIARKQHEPSPQQESPSQTRASQLPQGRAVLTRGMVQQLQRTRGNQAVLTLLRRTADDVRASHDEREQEEVPTAPHVDPSLSPVEERPSREPSGEGQDASAVPPSSQAPQADASGGSPATPQVEPRSPGSSTTPGTRANEAARGDPVATSSDGRTALQGTDDRNPAAERSDGVSSAGPSGQPPAGVGSAVVIAGVPAAGTAVGGLAGATDAEHDDVGLELTTGPAIDTTNASAQADAGDGANASDGAGVRTGALTALVLKREGIVTAAAYRRTRVEDARAAYLAEVSRSFTTQAQGVGQQFDASLRRVEQDLTHQVQQVRAAEIECVSQANTTASAEQDELAALQRNRHASLDDASQTNAEQARGAGATEATRALSGGEMRARRAAELVDERARPAAGNEGTAAFIRGVRADRLPRVQQRLRASAQEIATGVRQQAGDVAGHITGEAADGRSELTGFFGRATNAVGESHTETAGAIRQVADATVTNLEDAARQVTANLIHDRDVKIRELRSGEATMAIAIDGQVNPTLHHLERSAERNLSEIDWAVERVREGGGEPESTDQAVSDLNAEIDRSDAQHETIADQFVASVEQAATAADAQVAARATQITSALSTLCSELSGRFTATVASARQEMGTVLAEGLDQMRSPRPDADTASANAVGKAASGWQRQVREQSVRMANQIDDGFARQDNQLTTFASEIDGGLRDTRAESSGGGFLSSIGSFFSSLGDFLVGVLEGIGLALLGLLEGLWTLVTTLVGWVIIAIVVIVAAIVVVLFGWEALLISLLVMGLGVGLSMAVHYIYLAITQPDLSWRERGRLVGRALFDVALAALSVAELRGLASITKLGLMAQLARRLGGMGEAIRLIRILGSVERVLLVLERVEDVALATRLITTVRRFEDIVRFLDELGNAARVLDLIGHFGGAKALLAVIDALGTGARLEACINAFGGAAKLARAMRALGGAEQLARYISQLGDDAGRLAKLVDDVGGASAFARYVRTLGDDAGRLVGLIDDVSGAAAFLRYVRALGDDPARLRGLVDVCHSPEDFRGLLRMAGDDVVRLETMLRHAANDPSLLRDLLTQSSAATVEDIARLLEFVAGDIASLARLRGKVPDLVQLLRYVEQAGRGNVAALADLIDLTVARGFSVERIERLLTLADGTPGEFRRLTQALDRFPFPSPGAAPNAPVPTSIATGRFRIGESPIAEHRMSHYLERHVDTYFKFSSRNMDLNNTLWPSGTTATDVARFLDDALSLLQSQGKLTSSSLSQWAKVTLDNGITTRLLIQQGVREGILSVDSFHPMSGTGVDNLGKFGMLEMRAFRSLIRGVE